MRNFEEYLAVRTCTRILKIVAINRLNMVSLSSRVNFIPCKINKCDLPCDFGTSCYNSIIEKSCSKVNYLVYLSAFCLLTVIC